MANETLGADFSLDITELKAGLKTANSLIRQSESEFRAAAAGMGDWTQSAEGLEKRTKSLNDQVEIQQKKVESLVAEKEKAIEQLREQGKTEEEIATTLNTVNGYIEREAKQLDKLRDAAAKSQKELDAFNDETRETEEKAKKAADASKDLDDALGELKDVGGAAATVIGAISAAAFAAVGAFLNLAESTREYREDLAKLDTAFESAGHTTEEATKTYKELYSVFGEEDRAVEAAQQIAALAKNEEEMTRMTNIATGAWAMWGDSLATESLMEAANSTAKIGEVQGTLADALEWTGVNLDEFNDSLSKMATEEERSEHIMKTLNDLYGESADNYRENNEEIIKARKAQSDYNDELAELGRKAEPITTKVSEGFARILDKVNALVDDSGIDEMGGIIDDAFDDFIDDILPAIFDGVTWIIKHGDKIIGILGAIGAGFAAFKATTMIMNMVNAFKAMTTAITTAKVAQDGLNAAMSANIIGAIVTALVMLIQALASYAELADEAVNGWEKINDATEKNIAINERWQESMDAARATLADYSKMTNASGESSSDLKAKMQEAQDGITKIFETAYKENRELRDKEIEAVKQFNEDYVAAQHELSELQAAILKAQTDSLQWQIENLNLTEEETQGILNTLAEKREEYIAYMDESVAEEIAILDKRLQGGQLSEEEYDTLRTTALEKQREYRENSKEIQDQAVNDALTAMQKTYEIDMADYNNRTKTFGSLEEISSYYAEKIKAIHEDETKSWWTKMWEINAIEQAEVDDRMKFLQDTEVFWTDYSFLTDKSISANTQAFFNWIATNKEQGQTLTEQQRQNAIDIVAAYDDLPEELQESGLNALRGLAKGMEKEFPELEGAAEMDMEELIDAMNDALGNASPSKKMKEAGKNVMLGLEAGLEGRQSKTNSLASRIAGSLLSSFKKAFGIASPSKEMEKIGDFLGQGLSNGIDKSTKGVVNSATAQMSALRSVYDGGTFRGIRSQANKTNGAEGLANGSKSIVVNQTNNYSQAHSKAEIYRSERATYAAVRRAVSEVTG